MERIPSPGWRGALVALACLLAACTAAAEPGSPVPTPGSALTSGSVPTSSPGSPSAAPSPTAPPRVTIAYVEAAGLEAPGDRIAPAFQGARLAFRAASIAGGAPAEVELRPMDTGGDVPGTLEVAAGIARDPSIVAVIAAPGLPWQAALGDALGAAGVPWISLSGAGSDLGERGWTGWRRLVANQRAEGRALGRLVGDLRGARRGLCVLEEPGLPAGRLLAAVLRTAELPVRAQLAVDEAGLAEVSEFVRASGCGAVVWTGEGALGAAVRRRLVEAGLRRVSFVGTGRIRDQGFLEAAGAAAEGALAVSACTDVLTSTALAAQRFIQDYQAEFGLPPGPCAVEGWDAARLLLAALEEGGTDRRSLAAALETVGSFEGLARTYRFASGGDLGQPLEAVDTYEVEGGRWLARAG